MILFIFTFFENNQERFVTNPLLKKQHLPAFAEIKPEHILPALRQALDEAEKTVIELQTLSDQATWDNFAAKLEQVDISLDNIWSTVSHLNSVMDSAELREVYQQGKEQLTEFHTRLAQNLALYQGYKNIAARDDFSTLNAAKQKIVNNTIRDFKLSGAELSETDKKRFAELTQQLSKKQTLFEQNLLDATQSWYLHIKDKKELSGLPDYALDLAKSTAHQHDQQGYRFGLDVPTYLAVMKYADSTAIREKMYRAYSTRASLHSLNVNGETETKFDNEVVIDEILALRKEKAKLLGIDNFAELALITKMAENVDQVSRFLEDIAKYAKPKAKKELHELHEFANSQFKTTNLQPWDYSYYSEKLKQYEYDINSEEIKEYFPVETVINGMFDIVNRLFDIQFKKNDEPQTWHNDVLIYDLIDRNGQTTGQLFADLYARSNKRGGAWMGVCRHRQQTTKQNSNPVAYLTCNFTPAASGQPSLLTHDEVETLFHEFGHTLHHLLTQVDEMSLAGINGVAWDAVELPSQFLENWCWHSDSIPLISKHYQSGEPLPQSVLDKMLAAKHFQTGMQTVRQLEFSLFDIQLHAQNYQTPENSLSVQAILDQVRDLVAIVKTPEYHRFQCSFSHIFAGGYAAGYYSYKWAEVLSADAFGKFEEEGIFNAKTGLAFKDSILSQGGVPEAADMFANFRGREPKVNALLKSTGLL